MQHPGETYCKYY